MNSNEKKTPAKELILKKVPAVDPFLNVFVNYNGIEQEEEYFIELDGDIPHENGIHMMIDDWLMKNLKYMSADDIRMIENMENLKHKPEEKPKSLFDNIVQTITNGVKKMFEAQPESYKIKDGDPFNVLLNILANHNFKIKYVKGSPNRLTKYECKICVIHTDRKRRNYFIYKYPEYIQCTNLVARRYYGYDDKKLN